MHFFYSSHHTPVPFDNILSMPSFTRQVQVICTGVNELCQTNMRVLTERVHACFSAIAWFTLLISPSIRVGLSFRRLL